MTRPRNGQLDILRGLAILLVLGRHVVPGSGAGPVSAFFQTWARIGWSGVDLFFVLSGFLVSGLLFGEYRRTGRIDLRLFYIRRGLRILPAFYFMLAVSLVFVWRWIRFHQLPVEAFFLQNYLRREAIWPHTWTLAVEEHFYLVLGLLLLGLSKIRVANPFRMIPLLWALSAVACLFLRVMTPYDDLGVYIQSHLRADTFLFGVLLSYLHHFHREALIAWTRRFRIPIGLAAAFLVSPIFRLEIGREPFLTRFGLSGVYLAFGLILILFLFAVPLPQKPGPPARLLQNIGICSYSIYLWNYPLLSLVAQPLATRIGGAPGLWTGFSVYVMTSLALGFLSYYRLEKPILDWRDRRFPAPEARATTQENLP